MRAEGRALLRRMGVAGLVQMQVGMLALALYAGAFDGIEVAYRDYLRTWQTRTVPRMEFWRRKPKSSP